MLTELGVGFEILTPSSSPSTPTSPKPPPPPPSTPTPFQLPLGSGKRPAHPGGQSRDALSLTQHQVEGQGEEGPGSPRSPCPGAHVAWPQPPVPSTACSPAALGEPGGSGAGHQQGPSISPAKLLAARMECPAGSPGAQALSASDTHPSRGSHASWNHQGPGGPSGEQRVPGEGSARFTPLRRPFPGGGGAPEASGGCLNLSGSRVSTPLQGGKPRPKRSRRLGQVLPEEVGFHPQAGEEECLWVRETRGSGRAGVGAVPCLPGGLHRPCPGSLWLLQPYWVPGARTACLNGTQCPPTGVDHRVRARAQHQPDDLG